MDETSSISGILNQMHLLPIAKACLILVIGYFLARLARNGVGRLEALELSTHSLLLLKRIAFYGVLILTSVSVMRELGFDLSVVLGAAGILTVAIGFASQTSASNLISGLFLMMERPFSVGDNIKVGDTVGEVISIDLLSVKVRTFDNLFVRLPNESMIKTEVTTLTKFPIRRADIKVGIAYKEDIEKVKMILKELADNNPMCLEEPAPLFIILGFGNSSVDIQFSVWATRENYLNLKNTVYQEIKEAFDKHGVEIPFPHVSLYAGEASKPILISMLEQKNDGKV
jgi:small-conductance mechanosensitive channel